MTTIYDLGAVQIENQTLIDDSVDIVDSGRYGFLQEGNTATIKPDVEFMIIDTVDSDAVVPDILSIEMDTAGLNEFKIVVQSTAQVVLRFIRDDSKNLVKIDVTNSGGDLINEITPVVDGVESINDTLTPRLMFDTVAKNVKQNIYDQANIDAFQENDLIYSLQKPQGGYVVIPKNFENNGGFNYESEGTLPLHSHEVYDDWKYIYKGVDLEGFVFDISIGTRAEFVPTSRNASINGGKLLITISDESHSKYAMIAQTTFPRHIVDSSLYIDARTTTWDSKYMEFAAPSIDNRELTSFWGIGRTLCITITNRLDRQKYTTWIVRIPDVNNLSFNHHLLALKITHWLSHD